MVLKKKFIERADEELLAAQSDAEPTRESKFI